MIERVNVEHSGWDTNLVGCFVLDGIGLPKCEQVGKEGIKLNQWMESWNHDKEKK